jgi:hypothetical protein
MNKKEYFEKILDRSTEELNKELKNMKENR